MSVRAAFTDIFNRVFRDRQLLIRSEQGTSQFFFRRRHQLVLAGIATGVTVWAVAASTAFTIATFRVSDQAGQIDDLEIGYATLIADMSRRSQDAFAQASQLARQDGMTERMLVRTAELEDRVDELSATVEEMDLAAADLRSRNATLVEERDLLADQRDEALVEIDRRLEELSTIQATMASLEQDRNEAVDDAQRLRLSVSQLNAQLVDSEDRVGALADNVRELSGAVEAAYASVAALEAERDGLTVELASLSRRFDIEREHGTTLATLLRDAVVASVDAATQRDQALDRLGLLTGSIGRLENELASLRSYQEQVFARLRDSTENHLRGLESSLAVTGLDIEALLDEATSTASSFEGAGGPLIPLIDEAIAGRPGWIDAVETINLTDRAGLLWRLAGEMPIGYPVLDDHRLTSNFGPRRDPFTGRSAMHEGIDFAGTYGIPIHNTAPGTVAFAGRRNGYGNVIEIDHGHGLVTRYAHLQEILVEQGETVDYLQRIALMGSTGRSTGAHLHYEILDNGTPQNPMNFILAGQHVLEVAEQF
ncbi:MAG: peptidoglycan DD-metalloendopeptidase family protein [Azospirillaceae bacterium]